MEEHNVPIKCSIIIYVILGFFIKCFALHYLTIIKPNIAHVVIVRSSFMHKPWSFFKLSKGLFSTLKGTLQNGLSLTQSSSQALLAYLDVDLASCPNTRCSLSKFTIYFGDNIFSWKSKAVYDLKF